MRLKNLTLVIFLFIFSSIVFSQENPAPVEDGIIVRCPIGNKSTWYSVYIGSPNVRKNISLSIDSTIFGKTTKIAFKNSSGLPDTATGYYTIGSGIKQWKNRSSDYIYYRSDTTGAFWINIEYTNGPSLEYGGLNRKEVLDLIESNGGSDTIADTSLLVHKSAFSQSIEATGGDITLLSSLGNVVMTSNGLAEDDGGRIELTANASMTIITGAQFDIFCSDAVSIGASEDITFKVGLGKNYGFDNMAVVAGSVFGTADGYITIKINGGTLIDIPYKNH